MFEYAKDIEFDSILPRLKFVSAKQVITELAETAAKECKLDPAKLYEALITKEHESGSGIGDGVAVANLQVRGLKKPFLVLATLAREIDDFNSSDNQPVNLAALILSPESDGPLHLRRLSRVSRVLKNEILHKRLVEAQDELAIRSLMIDPEGWMLAA